MAVNLTKIYTKTGDKGMTRLVGGKKISKGDAALECYGTVDELNCYIGLIRTGLENLDAVEAISFSREIFKQIQNELFDIGSVLATPKEIAISGNKELSSSQIQNMENAIDKFLEELEPLKSFTLPGGSLINAHSHVARAVCRRLERLLWRQNETQPIQDNILIYINRLSDFLFVFSRWILKFEGKTEFLWEPGKK